MVTTKPVSEMTFEEALNELEETVKKIDNGQETLKSAIDAFERGSQLKAHCEKQLQDAKLKIEKIVHSQGVTTTEPVEL